MILNKQNKAMYSKQQINEQQTLAPLKRARNRPLLLTRESNRLKYRSGSGSGSRLFKNLGLGSVWVHVHEI